MSPSNFSEGHLLKMGWLVTDVTAVGSYPLKERNVLFWMVISTGHFVSQFRPYLWLGSHFVIQEHPLEL